MKIAGLASTRRSLVDRLANWDDQKRWQEYFDTYGKLIYSTARKAGLTDTIRRSVHSKAGSFKSRAGESLINFGNANPAKQNVCAKRMTDSRRRSNACRTRALSILMKSGKPNGKRICWRRRSRERKKKSIRSNSRFSIVTCAKSGRPKKWQINYASASGRFISRGIALAQC